MARGHTHTVSVCMSSVLVYVCVKCAPYDQMNVLFALINKRRFDVQKERNSNKIIGYEKHT